MTRVFAALIALVVSLPAAAQYPAKPVTMLAGYPPGGLVDVVARLAPKGTPAPVIKYLHDAAKAAIEDPKFAADMANRGIDVDYRAGSRFKADLWREYKAHTEILSRIGMLKK